MGERKWILSTNGGKVGDVVMAEVCAMSREVQFLLKNNISLAVILG